LNRNIDVRGRLWRGLIGLGLFGMASVWALTFSNPLRWIAAVPAAAAVFLIFEAAAGWCAARACGLRTPL
jgi:hypothetical protein